MENTLLDHDELQPNELIIASTGKRFANYLIDVIGFYIFVILFGGIFGFLFFSEESEAGTSIIVSWFFGIVIIVSYYTLLEGSLRGKTLGKYITRTRAVTADGEPVDFHKAFIRSLCRLIPFEAFSYLGGGLGWHDTISNTMVVEDNGQWE